MSARRITSIALVVLASVCLIGALVAGYLRVAVLDSHQFADRATAALEQPAVRDVVAREITDQAVLRANRDLVAVRPLVQTAAGAIVGTPAFRSLFHKAVADLHRTVFTRDRHTATLTIADVGVLLSGALQKLDPKIAARLPADFTARLSGGETLVDALDYADTADGIRELAWLLAIATVVLLAAAIAVAPGRRQAIVDAGIGVAAAGAIVVLAYQIGRGLVLDRFTLPDDRAAAGEVFDAFGQDLRTWALATVVIGAVVGAAAASLLRPVDVRVPLRRAWALVATVPVKPWQRVGRALALIVAGVLIIAERQWMLDVALVLAGVYVLYHGVAELLRMIAQPAAAGAEAEARPVAANPSPKRHGWRPWLAGGVALLLVALAVAGLFGSGATDAGASNEVTACNGHAELCDRPLNEVVFAGTHNAMSSATYPNYLFAQQEKGLSGQLQDGVRALLIDAHFGFEEGSRVLTDLAGRKERAAIEEEIGPSAAAAALRIRETILGGGNQRGPRSMWLCHGFCEVGAVPLENGLREVSDFVANHPDEVILLVIQDEGPTPRDLAKAIEDSGLGSFVYRGGMGKPWPTLREMIDEDQRVVVLTENSKYDPSVPWIHNAFDVMQETPYHFTAPSQFSCAPNRGSGSNSLFLINHWIDTSPAPRPSNAAKVNAYAPLLRRARACEKERGLLPNVIAVDFYRTGDLMKVVDTLNRIPTQQP